MNSWNDQYRRCRQSTQREQHAMRSVQNTLHTSRVIIGSSLPTQLTRWSQGDFDKHDRQVILSSVL